jgi:RNA polymerase sigma-70 factor (sigma-E family)
MTMAGVTSAATDEFTAFMADASPRLAHTAWLITGDEHLAEELVQEALTRTFLAWRKVRHRDPYSYARRVLVGQRHGEKAKRIREPLVAPPALPDVARDGEEGTVIERDRLARALATLTQRQRDIVVLRYLVGMSEQEVADDLGVSLGTVKSTASRGLAQLRDVLESADHDHHADAPQPADNRHSANTFEGGLRD